MLKRLCCQGQLYWKSSTIRKMEYEHFKMTKKSNTKQKVSTAFFKISANGLKRVSCYNNFSYSTWKHVHLKSTTEVFSITEFAWISNTTHCSVSLHFALHFISWHLYSKKNRFFYGPRCSLNWWVFSLRLFHHCGARRANSCDLVER